MKVVVMGGAGKVGRYVVRELLRDEDGRPAHDVSVFDRAASAELPVPQTVGDHADFEAVAKALEGAEAVIHLSAYPGPGLAPDYVLFQGNVAGTFNVHDAASRMGVRRVVTLSSESILGWTFSTRPFVPDYLPIDRGTSASPPRCLRAIEGGGRSNRAVVHGGGLHGDRCPPGELGSVARGA